MKKTIIYLKRIGKSFIDNDFFGMASEMGFMMVIGVFPFMLFLTAVFGWIGKHEFIKPVFRFMSTIMPQDAINLIKTVMNEAFFCNKSGTLAVFGIIISLILTTNAMAIVLKGMNRAYKLEETRNLVYTRVLSLIMVFINTAILFLSINLIIFGRLIINFLVTYLSLPDVIANTLLLIRWPIAFIALYLMAFLQYYILPDMKGPELLKLKSTIPGTFFFCIFWLIGSTGFSVYVNNLHTYNFVYGTIGAFAVLMVWLYYTSMLILVGAEINSQVYNRLEIKNNSK